MAKIVVTYGVPAEGFSLLAGHEVVIPPSGTAFSREELLRLLPDADAVLACTALDSGLIAAAKKLKLIVCYGAGYDAIDVAAATAQGIPVVNTPECVTAPTAELTIALITALARRLPELNALMHTRPPRELFGMGLRMGSSLEGAVMGVAGMGRIGGRVADFARLMGMRVLYASRTPKPGRDALGDVRVTIRASGGEEAVFWLEGRPLALRRPLCGVEAEGEGFLLRLSCQTAADSEAPGPAELEKLGQLCTAFVRKRWAAGQDLLGLGAYRALWGGGTLDPKKDACPQLRTSVGVY